MVKNHYLYHRCLLKNLSQRPPHIHTHSELSPQDTHISVYKLVSLYTDLYTVSPVTLKTADSEKIVLGPVRGAKEACMTGSSYRNMVLDFLSPALSSSLR